MTDVVQRLTERLITAVGGQGVSRWGQDMGSKKTGHPHGDLQADAAAGPR